MRYQKYVRADDSRYPTSGVSPGPLIGIAGAMIAALGSVMPWASLTAPFIGTLTVNGTDGDGKITLALTLGAAALFLLVWLAHPVGSGRAALITLSLLVGVICLFVAIADGQDVAGRVARAKADSNVITASTAPGLYLVGVGGLLCVIGAIASYRGRD